jgi:hypothetical protein
LQKNLICEQPSRISREELEAEFGSDDPERILYALIAASYTEPPDRVQEKCFKFATHPGEPARRGAAIVLGSIAFAHGPINFVRAVATPEELRRDAVARFRENYQKYNIRHSCRVGMTGWAQVNGLRGDTSIPDRLRYDLYYIYNWSFALDLQIIARTMFTVVKDQNGY